MSFIAGTEINFYRQLAIWTPKFKNLVAQVSPVRTTNMLGDMPPPPPPHENFEFFKSKSFILSYLKKVELAKKESIFLLLFYMKLSGNS
jgi:hypothetical protein